MTAADLDRFERRNDLRKRMARAEGHQDRCTLAQRYPEGFADPRYDLPEADIDDLIAEIRRLRGIILTDKPPQR